jgi:hypothetical protein
VCGDQLLNEANIAGADRAASVSPFACHREDTV